MANLVEMFYGKLSSFDFIHSCVIEPQGSPGECDDWRCTSKISDFRQEFAGQDRTNQNSVGWKFLHLSQDPFFLIGILGGVTDEGYKTFGTQAFLDC
jgi:hypothetical protein